MILPVGVGLLVALGAGETLGMGTTVVVGITTGHGSGVVTLPSHCPVSRQSIHVILMLYFEIWLPTIGDNSSGINVHTSTIKWQLKQNFWPCKRHHHALLIEPVCRKLYCRMVSSVYCTCKTPHIAKGETQSIKLPVQYVSQVLLVIQHE